MMKHRLEGVEWEKILFYKLDLYPKSSGRKNKSEKHLEPHEVEFHLRIHETLAVTRGSSGPLLHYKKSPLLMVINTSSYTINHA